MYKGLATSLDPAHVPFTRMIQRLKELNVAHLRVWKQINWDSPPTHAAYEHLAPYTDAGIHILQTVHTDTLPTPDQAKRYFEQLAAVAPRRVHCFQILNEINLQIYWPHTFAEAIYRVVQPAAKALTLASGFVGPSISEDRHNTEIRKLIDFKTDLPQDAFDFHPYGANAKEFATRLTAARLQLRPWQRLILTEAQVHGASTSGWISYQKPIWDAAKAAKVSSFYYYCGIYNGQLAGKAGLMLPDTLEPRQPWFNTYKSLA